MLTIKEYIAKAIHTNLGITIKYLNSDGDKTIRKISDIQFSDELGDDYVHAFCHLRKEYRTFKIDRILEIDSLFYCPNDLHETPPPSRYWQSFGDEYSLKEIWAATNPGLYEQIEGDKAEIISVQFADGCISYYIAIPLNNGSHKDLKLSPLSSLEEGDMVSISSITGREIYKIDYTNVISIFRYNGVSCELESKEWDISKKYNLKDLWDNLFPGLYNQIDGDYAVIKPINYSLNYINYNNLSYLRIMVPFKDGSHFELKLSGFSNLKENDKVPISSIIGLEFIKNDCNPIIRYDIKDEFSQNYSLWEPFGEKYTLREVWSVTNPGLYEQINGDEAEVTVITFSDGKIGLRITVPFIDGSSIDLKLSCKSDLIEGDKVKVDTITCQEFHKEGQHPIVRYDGIPIDD